MGINLTESENFISKDACQEIITKFGHSLEQASVLEGVSGVVNQKYRIAEGRWISSNEDKLIESIKKRVSILTGTPMENQESPHLVRYDRGGKYDAHNDYFQENDGTYISECIPRGGQRVYTCIVYLNEEFSGGATDFPLLNQMVIPKTGKLVFWRNVDERATPIKESLHAAMPIASGTKWVLIFWIRENKFI